MIEPARPVLDIVVPGADASLKDRRKYEELRALSDEVFLSVSDSLRVVGTMIEVDGRAARIATIDSLETLLTCRTIHEIFVAANDPILVNLCGLSSVFKATQATHAFIVAFLAYTGFEVEIGAGVVK